MGEKKLILCKNELTGSCDLPEVGPRIIIHQTGIDGLEFSDEVGPLAPRPGSLVVLHARSANDKTLEFDPLLLSAIDARTHLQLARFYLTTTIASALDFEEYFFHAFPFSAKEIRTPLHPLFNDSSVCHADHRFTRALHQRNVQHTFGVNSKHSLIGYFSQYFFPGELPDSLHEGTINKFLLQLRNHLYFHNNHRTIPAMHGNTPLQALKDLSGFSSLDAFDPFDEPSAACDRTGRAHASP